ncbi:TPA: type II toxin-antitoxin system RelE/ParE family toxin, partial [Streptococcus equi subsp. equi]|nr:type II toxin-antitoxin system RelE/ParE family toxin [Streptococcus equi subsp. equi]
MAYDIYISNKAEQDLDEIYNYYLTEFSHSSAQKVIESLQSAISILEISPEGYVDFDDRVGRKLFPEGQLRMIPSKHFIVFYLIRQSRVDILRIRSTKTDYL